MWEITKAFDFCYGHRVYTQKLDAELSCNASCKCRHLHGHQGKVNITLASGSLHQGMVTDFHHLNWVKKWIDDYFDHKMIMDVSDPFLKSMLSFIPQWNRYFNITQPTSTSTHISLLHYDSLQLLDIPISPEEQEVLEGLTLVYFIPTSENLAAFIYAWVSAKMHRHCDETGIYVKSVEFQETPKSSSIYIG